MFSGEGIRTTMPITMAIRIDRPNKTSFLIVGILFLSLSRGGVDRLLAGDVFGVNHVLELVEIDFLDVLVAARPLAALQAGDTVDAFHEPLEQQRESGNRNDGLEGIERGTIGGETGCLADDEGFFGVVKPGPAQGD